MGKSSLITASPRKERRSIPYGGIVLWGREVDEGKDEDGKGNGG